MQYLPDDGKLNVNVYQGDWVWAEFETSIDDDEIMNGDLGKWKLELIDAGFTENEAEDWYCLCRDYKNLDNDLVPLDKIDPEVVKEYLEESIHGGWEGFRPEHMVALDLMINDLRRYAYHLSKDLAKS